MNKKIIISGFLFVAFFIFSCNSSGSRTDNNEVSDEINSCVEVVDFYADGAGEVCPLQNSSDGLKRQINVACSFESSNYKTGENFIVEKVENTKYKDKDSVSLKGKCVSGCQEEDWCGAGFIGFDKSLFNQSLIGKELIIYWIEGFYSDAYSEYIPRNLQVVRHKDGTLIAVSGVGIVNEDGEHEWDIKVWPSKLVPEIKVEQKVLSGCESICVKYMAGEDGKQESLYYDNLIAPPLEITVEGKMPVVVKNGEVVDSEGYEYFVRQSLRATEDDADGFVFTLGKKYRFDFFILNTETLK